jgi:hypothetical protein
MQKPQQPHINMRLDGVLNNQAQPNPYLPPGFHTNAVLNQTTYYDKKLSAVPYTKDTITPQQYTGVPIHQGNYHSREPSRDLNQSGEFKKNQRVINNTTMLAAPNEAPKPYNRFIENKQLGAAPWQPFQVQAKKPPKIIRQQQINYVRDYQNTVIASYGNGKIEYFKGIF